MSVQHNIYLMWGMKLDPDNLPKDDLDEPITEWGESSAFTTKVKHKDNLYMLYDGMDEEYVILGRVIGKTDDDGNTGLDLCQEINVLTEKEKKLVQDSIKRNFGIEPDCRYYLINHYS